MSPTVRNNFIYSPTHAYFPTIFTPPPTSDWPWPPTDWSPSHINTGHIQLVLTHIAAPVEDGTDTVFQNVGLYYSDAREIPRRQFIITTTQRKFKI